MPGGEAVLVDGFSFPWKQEAGPLLRLRWEDRKGKSAGEERGFEITTGKNEQAWEGGVAGRPGTGSSQGLRGTRSCEFTKGHTCGTCPLRSRCKRAYIGLNLCTIRILQTRHRVVETWARQG